MSDLAICTGNNIFYIARVRHGRFHYWREKSRHRSYRAAATAMVKAFIGGGYKRADVLMTSDYYDPVQLCELVRR